MLESSKEASTYSRIPEARNAPKVQKEMGEKSISLKTSLFLSLTSSKPLVCQEEASLVLALIEEGMVALSP